MKHFALIAGLLFAATSASAMLTPGYSDDPRDAARDSLGEVTLGQVTRGIAPGVTDPRALSLGGEERVTTSFPADSLYETETNILR